jgi:membrane protein
MGFVDRTVEMLHRTREFLLRDVWDVSPAEHGALRGLVMKHVRVVVLLFQNLGKNQLLLRASALAFTTLLSIVPFLALIFFVIETFGLDEELYKYAGRALGVLHVATEAAEPTPTDIPEDEVARQDGDLQQGIIEPEAQGPPSPGSAVPPGTAPAEPDAMPRGARRDFRQDVAEFLLRFGAQDSQDMQNPIKVIVDYAKRGENPRAIGLVGLIFIITTVFGLINNVESAFNQIWGIKDTRSWYRMFSDYVMMVLLLPFFVAGMVTVTTVLKTVDLRMGEAIVYNLAQYAIIWAGFAVLYYIVPNACVMLRYAVLGGIVGGTLWNGLNWVYVTFQYGLRGSSIFYSTLAQFPVLLMWIYFSWVILLFGAELTYAYQNEKVFLLERLAGRASFAYREALGLRTMVELARRFVRGRGGLEPQEAAREWNVPLRILNDVLYEFEQARLVVRLATTPPTFLPARPLQQITVANVIAVLREAGTEPTPLRYDPEYHAILERLKASNGSAAIPLSDLAREDGELAPPSARLEWHPTFPEGAPNTPADSGDDDPRPSE